MVEISEFVHINKKLTGTLRYLLFSINIFVAAARFRLIMKKGGFTDKRVNLIDCIDKSKRKIEVFIPLMERREILEKTHTSGIPKNVQNIFLIFFLKFEFFNFHWFLLIWNYIFAVYGTLLLSNTRVSYMVKMVLFSAFYTCIKICNAAHQFLVIDENINLKQ